MSATTAPVLADSATAVDLATAWGALTLCCARTPSGAAELRQPAHALPAPARELLGLVDPGVAIDHCVSAAAQAQLSDAMLLLSLGLVRTTSFEAAATIGAGRVQLRPLLDALLALSSDELYTLLTQQAKRRLGLLQGFRTVLALERCNGPHEQRALAVRFVQEIWRMHGAAGVLPLQRLLKR
jgi:hypothetical protein